MEIHGNQAWWIASNDRFTAASLYEHFLLGILRAGAAGLDQLVGLRVPLPLDGP
jgi:hypothetical protein